MISFRRRRERGGVGLKLLGLLSLVGVGAAGWVWLRPAPEEPAMAVSTKERRAPSVIVAISSLARLEGVSFHMERVVELKKTEQALWGLVEAEDELLLVAAGDVVAGVDLAKLRAGDIVADEARHQVRIVLPPPEVFSSHLDNQHTHVHSRDTDLLATGDESLETEARKRAEGTIHDAAIASGILEHARRNVGHTIQALAMSFGYETVVIEWRRE